MANVKNIIELVIGLVVIIVLVGVVPMIGSTVDDSYTITDTTATGWNATTNPDLDPPASMWTTFAGFIVLLILITIVGYIIKSFGGMTN